MIYTDNKQLTNELKKTFIDAGMNQREIAAALEVSPQTLQHLLNKKQLSFADVARVLDTFDYKLEYSFTPGSAEL